MFSFEDEVVWSVAGAKEKLSEVMKRAQSTPQVITCHGKPRVVVVAVDEWRHKTQRKGSFAEFLRTSPLCESGADLERQHDEPRALEGFVL